MIRLIDITSKLKNLASKLRVLKNKKVIIALVSLAVLVLLTYLYFSLFFGIDECLTEYCFKENLKDCKKTTFTYLQENTIWLYSIKGTQADSCKVLVKVEEVKKETASTMVLEGKEMDCYIPKGVAVMPEEKIEYCHGILKEAIQDQIIERMHLYIVQKIGQIEEELGIVNATEENETQD